MKPILLILVMVLLIETVNAVQPARKPFLQIKIDGKPFKSGEIISVTPGQKMNIVVDWEGGRRDFCKYPDTYADIAGTAQILSRGDNGLTYQLNGSKAEWKLQSEIFKFSPDNNIKVKSVENQNIAELTISDAKFVQSFVKVSVNATWQFIQEGKITNEENLAEETIYFKLAGASDDWFSAQNVQASGLSNALVQEKLNLVQSECDSISMNFHRLNFPAAQQAIRNLQGTITALKATIDEVKTTNPSYQTKIIFLGLPSDAAYGDIGVFNSIKTTWEPLEALVNDLKSQAAKLPEQPSAENNKKLLALIDQYQEWHSKLNDKQIKTLNDYIPEIKPEAVALSGSLSASAAAKSVSDYARTLSDFNSFLDLRIEQVPSETQQINSAQSRLQAVRLFDGMLRGYFSSIAWAEWKSARDSGF